MHIFSVYVNDLTETGYSLSIEASDIADPDTLKRIAREVADQLEAVPSDEYPETDGPALVRDVK